VFDANPNDSAKPKTVFGLKRSSLADKTCMEATMQKVCGIHGTVKIKKYGATTRDGNALTLVARERRCETAKKKNQYDKKLSCCWPERFKNPIKFDMKMRGGKHETKMSISLTS